ncbi:chromosome partitioning protein [Rhodopseudomonas faecalis]|uniref:Chromosome partitioning protein n=2 Tax=Rhodopseudomonas faecalis TaxID=99655 RepID=A0A318TDQ7_9BRAD|nr:chromosome partitioning protein [Rhodopseudomonas faecalis]
MMHTIVLTTRKGGSGKSTLAVGLALAAMQAGHAVRLIETDPQGTLSRWLRRRPKTHPMVDAIHDMASFEQRLLLLERAGVTVTLVDTAGGDNAMTAAVLQRADLCLIPTRPCIADVEASAATLGEIRSRARPFAFVLNQAPHRGQRIAHAADTLGEQAAVAADGLIARPFIVLRNDHQDAMAAGLAVSEFAPAGKSADEIRGLWRWIEQRLGCGRDTPEFALDDDAAVPAASAHLAARPEAPCGPL